MVSLKKKFSKNKYYFFIIAVALAGYWQVAFFNDTLKWDMLDQYFPWRYFVSECLNNKIVPFWNPYESWGYASLADPQSGVWYPVIWLISFFHGYDLYANQFDFVFHIVLAGTGMFLLINHFVKHAQAAFIIACSYMLSGFFVGNAQHLTYIVSGTWIPFVILYYTKITERPNYNDAIRCALAFYMLITGGYPAFTIILSYSLLIIFFTQIILKYSKKDFSGFKKFISSNILFFILSLILSSGMLLSEYISKDFINRSEKLPLSLVNVCPFSPQSLISLMLPLSSSKDDQFFDTDISMSNLYFGIFCLLIFVVAFFRKKTSFEKIVLGCGLFFLLAAFGKYTPVRAALYHFVPLMNLFRFPSIFRLFALICFLIVTAFSLRDLLEREPVAIKRFRNALLLFVGVFILVFFIFRTKTAVRMPAIFSPAFTKSVITFSFNESIVLQSLWMLILLAGAWFIFFKRKKNSSGFIVFVVILDLLVATQLSSPMTVISEDKTASLFRRMEVFPRHGFPVPENGAAINYSDSLKPVYPLWRNLGIWYKQPNFDGYNSFRMKGHFKLDQLHQLSFPLLHNNVAFFSDSFSFYNDTVPDFKKWDMDSSHLFFSEKDRAKIPYQNLKLDSTDKAVFEQFNPEKITIRTSSSHQQLFTLMQHDFPGWHIFLDGKKVDHVVSDYLFMTIFLPEGNHVIEYRFEMKNLIIAWIISVFTLLVCIFIVLKELFHRKDVLTTGL